MEENDETKKPAPITGREAGMMVIVGSQGVGKTYNGMQVIAKHVKGDIKKRVKPRKCLIFDTNGEYGKSQFTANGVPDFEARRISIADVEAWGRSPIAECRRIDAKSLSPKQKIECVEHIVKVYRNGMLILDDINTYILNVTHEQDIIGGLVNLRHRAVDVLVSYQSLRAVEPRIFANCRWVRMHYQSDDVDHVKGKLPSVQLFKIAQIIVNEKYFGGDKRFFLFVMKNDNKIIGKFTISDFRLACKKYLSLNKKEVNDYAAMNDIAKADALEAKIQHLVDMYYGNDNLKKKSK